ncbi:MORN variant repeat protein [Pithovirus sibericum]|uniref:MORN variant repeat protein n=1 Tax=Pithovirus sibericum TaxID=1450746 RepID=W5S4Z7_9VIRU|nr:MORN variant repeat protein [Pithovirus sibericum]AHH01729.1 MORN variant repeat protein [Pithovirus sibericum]
MSFLSWNAFLSRTSDTSTESLVYFPEVKNFTSINEGKKVFPEARYSSGGKVVYAFRETGLFQSGSVAYNFFWICDADKVPNIFTLGEFPSFGKIHGLFESFYENGNRREISKWNKGKEHGSSYFWHENGQMAHRSEWVRGILEGIFYSWDEQGTMVTSEFYLNGNPAPILEVEDLKY